MQADAGRVQGPPGSFQLIDLKARGRDGQMRAQMTAQVNPKALEIGFKYAHVAHPLHRHLEQVAVEHNEIGGFAGLDGTGLLFVAQRRSGIGRSRSGDGVQTDANRFISGGASSP